MPRAFTLNSPKRQSTAFVFASPHSGRDYPPAFLARSRLTAGALRSSEDAFVDHLFDSVPECGAPLLAARYPRAWVDLNRAEDELDPALIAGLASLPRNPRVASGLGVVPRVVSGGKAIYDGKLTLREARVRLRAGWQPYHAALAELLDDTRKTFGQAVLIDCHSMPRESLDGVRTGGRRPDVVLGDRFGVSAAREMVDLVEEVFRDAGLTVSRNAPFAGAHIVQRYGRPSRHVHAVQIEINRALYMDEARITPHEGWDAFKAVIDGIVARLCEMGRPSEMSVAAE